MGKYGIGARVRDDDGDEGVIVDKRKGERLVRYDKGWTGELWRTKSEIEVVPANDDASAALAADAKFKVGDRVRFTAECPTGWWFGPHTAHTEGVVVKCGRGAGYQYEVRVDSKGGAIGHVDAQHIEAVSGTGHAYSVGDRVIAKGRGYGDTEGAGAVSSVSSDDVCVEFSDGWDDGHDGQKGDGANTRWYFPFDDVRPAELRLEAGKFYRTAAGKKVGPMRDTDCGDGFPWRGYGVNEYFSAAGKSQFDGDNLVEEWGDEPASPDPIFKIGDRVGIGSLDANPGTVTDLGDDKVKVRWDRHESYHRDWYDDDELAFIFRPSFIVCKLTDEGEPRPASNPHVHATQDDAAAEARRLTHTEGGNFAVYQRIAA